MIKVEHISKRKLSCNSFVYIGRPSKWGNPFIIGKDGDRIKVIAKYREWIKTQPELLANLSELQDKILLCYCSPLPCHGDILKELAEKLT